MANMSQDHGGAANATSPLYNFVCGVFGFKHLYNAGVHHGETMSSRDAERKKFWQRHREGGLAEHKTEENDLDVHDVPYHEWSWAMGSDGENGDAGDEDDDEWMRLIKAELARARHQQTQMWNDVRNAFGFEAPDDTNETTKDPSAEGRLPTHQSKSHDALDRPRLESHPIVPFWQQADRFDDIYDELLRNVDGSNPQPRTPETNTKAAHSSALAQSHDHSKQTDAPPSDEKWWHGPLDNIWRSSHSTSQLSQADDDVDDQQSHQSCMSQLACQIQKQVREEMSHHQSAWSDLHRAWPDPSSPNMSASTSYQNSTTIEHTDQGVLRRTVSSETDENGTRKTTIVSRTRPDGQTETTESTEFLPAIASSPGRLRDVTSSSPPESVTKSLMPMSETETPRSVTDEAKRVKGGWFWSSGRQ